MKLQKDYTTPEQSKRLLELGVPADSADMYYKHTMLAPYTLNNGVLFSAYLKVEDIVPCWSVGRLIEIYELCYGEVFERDPFYPVIDDILLQINYAIIDTTEQWDFSKLEE